MARFAKDSSYGVSGSISKFSNTWYMGFKSISGVEVGEQDLDNPLTIKQGFMEGGQGLGRELFSGVTGVFIVPQQSVKQKGLGCS